MKMYTEAEVVEMTLGPIGTPERDEYEEMMADFKLGLAIKQARESQKLTQEQLGEKIGVQKARISSIERGANLRLSTIRRIFKALGMEVKLDISSMQPVPIC